MFKGWTWTPSATSPAMRSIQGLTAAMSTGGSAHVDGARRPHGWQQGEAVELALHRQRRAVAEGPEDLLHGQHVLAQSRSRMVEVRAVAALHVRSYLCAQSQPEAAPARLCQLPRRGRCHHRAAREGHGDPGQHVDVGRGHERAAGEVRRASRLGHDQARQAGFRRPPPERGRLTEGLGRQHGVELQGQRTASPLTPPSAPSVPSVARPAAPAPSR